MIRFTRFLRFFFKYGLIGVLLFIFYANTVIGDFSRDRLYERVAVVPQHDYAVVLGTSQYLASGGRNPFFAHRVQATAELFHAGKIRYVVASGDNRTPAYNEPAALEAALAEAGVPPSNVIRDGGGVGTLQSMRRARDVYGLERFIVVSQRFHNERAVYLASHMGVDVIGYNAADVTGTTALRTNVREYFARVKALVDARFRLR